MGVGSLTASNWTVSTRQDGEVLAIWAGSDELQLGVFATRDGFSPIELEGWLKDLVNVARESARQDPSAREIPTLLHHALTGLLFSHAELWERAGGMYFSSALVCVDGLVGIGWVGEADLQVHVEGVLQEIDWVLVRDSEGREACAATFDARLPLHFWVSWNPGMDAESGIAVDAEWNPEPRDGEGEGRTGRGAKLIELTADDLAPVMDEAEYPIEAESGADPELAEAPTLDENMAEYAPELEIEVEPEQEPEFEPALQDAPEPEPETATLSDDFVQEREFAPPRSRAPSAIREALDLDRYGVEAFEDAQQVASEAPADAGLEGAPMDTGPEPITMGSRYEPLEAEAAPEVAGEESPEWSASPGDLELGEAPPAEAPEIGSAPDTEEGDEDESAKRPARRAGMWGRVASLWQKKASRSPDLELKGPENTTESGETPLGTEEVGPSPEPTAPIAAQPAPAAPPIAPKRAPSAPSLAKSAPAAPPIAPKRAPSAPSLAKRPPVAKSVPGAQPLVQPRDEAVAPAPANPVAGPPSLIQPRSEVVAPAEAPLEQRPPRLAPSKPVRPAQAPKEPASEETKPPALPEERMAPMSRTSPERPSLRGAPSSAPEREAPPARTGRAAPARAPRPVEPSVDPEVPQNLSPPELEASAPVVEPEVAPAAEPEHEPVAEPEVAPAAEPTAEPAAAAAGPVSAPSSPEAPKARAEKTPETKARAEKAPAEPAAAAAPRAPAETAAAPAVAAAPAAVRAPIRAQWPSEEEMASPLTRWMRAIFGVVLVSALFAAGWLLGGVKVDRWSTTKKVNPLFQILEGFSFATGRYHVAVATEPDGASIAVDGRDVAKRTPAVIDLKPGAHQVTLSFPDLGSATFGVRGTRDQNVPLHEALWGRLTVEQDNPEVPVSVSVDGRELGFVPVTIDSVSPGAHDVRFSGPGMTPWAQTVAVKVRESARIVAHPMVSPATGVLSVRATLNDDSGSSPLAGGEVWLDGELVGRTPLTLELPRGPHSVKLVYGQQTAPVQVIDLPGGNQRFAAFQIGAAGQDIRLTPASVVTRVLADQPALVSAGLNGVNLSDVREMWLHVRGPDDNWRRYALNVMKTPDGVVGVSTFPLGVFDDNGITKYYLSALLITGDEYFTEIASAQLVSTPSAPGAN